MRDTKPTRMKMGSKLDHASSMPKWSPARKGGPMLTRGGGSGYIQLPLDGGLLLVASRSPSVYRT